MPERKILPAVKTPVKLTPVDNGTFDKFFLDHRGEKSLEGMETEEGDFNPDDFPDDNPDGEPDPQYEYRARLGLTPPGSVFGGDSPIPPFCPPPDGYSWESVSDKLYGIIRCSQSLFRDEIEEMSEEAAEAGRTEW
jgi:hypothetical protein